MSIKYIQRKFSSETPFKEALIELIKSNGNYLIISTGYIFEFLNDDGSEKRNIYYTKKNMLEIKQAILDSLINNDLNVTIIGGNDEKKIPDFKYFCNEINNYIRGKIIEKKILYNYKLIYKQVIGNNWHGKVAIKYKSDNDNTNISAIIVGSSNISNSTMQINGLYWTREADIYIKKGIDTKKEFEVENELKLDKIDKELNILLVDINKELKSFNEDYNQFLYEHLDETNAQKKFFEYRKYYKENIKILIQNIDSEKLINFEIIFCKYIDLLKLIENKNIYEDAINNIAKEIDQDIIKIDVLNTSLNELNIYRKKLKLMKENKNISNSTFLKISTAEEVLTKNLKSLMSIKDNFTMNTYYDFLDSLMLSIYRDIKFVDNYLTEEEGYC